jgi:hypothetical protein
MPELGFPLPLWFLIEMEPVDSASSILRTQSVVQMKFQENNHREMLE